MVQELTRSYTNGMFIVSVFIQHSFRLTESGISVADIRALMDFQLIAATLIGMRKHAVLLLVLMRLYAYSNRASTHLYCDSYKRI